MACVPTANAVVLKVACPALFSVAVPSTVVMSLKVTVPVGFPLPGALACTVAVNVTACPTTAGFTLEVTPVVVASFWTTSLYPGVALARKLPSPP